ncbi:DUF1648 domain-containing protein [Bacillus testis]|uniref:DUF1648 domain-containing protein n=1 Tax=Bacillus testis TaxID=1622072 RepID=UPI00067EA6F5|nr:DUF5808 domain-containing protein [Bacillus testis]
MEGLLLFILLLPAILLAATIPYLTRKTELFGVSLPESVSRRSDINRMRKQYAYRTGIASILLTGLIVAGHYLYPAYLTENIMAVIILIPIVVVPAAFYVPSHKELKKLKFKEGWFTDQHTERRIVNTSFRSQKPVYSFYWFAIPALVILVTALLAYVKYDSLPSRIPTHFDFQGNADGYSAKTPMSVASIPLMQAFLLVVMVGVNIGIMKAKQQIDSSNPGKSLEQNLAFRRIWSGYSIIAAILISALFLMIELISFGMFPERAGTYISLALAFLLVVGAIILSFKTGQGGSRLKGAAGKETAYTNTDDDEHWKGGIFYWNKNDPSFFVEKRFGIGWTCNFAHPLSWIILGGIILVPILLSIL